MRQINIIKTTVYCLLFLPLWASAQCAVDSINPTAICKNISVSLDANGIVSVAASQIDNGSTDNCGLANLLINGSNVVNFNCSNVGVQVLTLTVIDSAGNSSNCSANVTILDTIPPMAICQNAVVYLGGGSITLYSVDVDSGSWDACSVIYRSINGNDSLTFTVADTGLNIVTLTTYDPSYNSSNCVANITVLDTSSSCLSDTIAPAALCIGQSLDVYLGSFSGAVGIVPAAVDAGSTDNCGIASMSINGSNSAFFNCSDVGIVNTIVLTVTDYANNSSQCVATVNVLDTTPPEAFCKNIQVYLAAAGQVVVPATALDTFSYDNCGISTYLINGTTSYTFNSSNLGFNTATLTVIDSFGNSSTCNAVVHVLDTLGFTAVISGNVFDDTNFNCNKEITEQQLRNITVVAAGQQTYYQTTDAQGNYSIAVDTGNYIVYPIFPAPYWSVCLDSQQVYAPAGALVDSIDFAFQAWTNCPYLEVDIAAPFLRSTGNSYYNVSYCNSGTAMANNSTVEVEIDPDLIVLGSSVPIQSQNGSVYTFNIGNVGINQCGNFFISVLVQPTAIIGQTHCTEALIYPDSVCLDPWSGANLSVDVVCDIDTVRFTVLNNGPAAVINKSFTIIEDHVIMMVGNTGAIGSGSSTQIAIPALSEKTYRLMVDQDPTFPSILGSPVATAAIEGCVPNSLGGFNTGYITQFYNDNTSPFVAVDCQQNIASYDPNDKSAQPEGYDANYHYINAKDVLDYRIRFQNTGTDTAFTVVVRDTLSSFLNVESIKMGAASHDYTWNLSDQGVLEVVFEDIMLPDSNVNEPLSHGFFNFQIEQKDNNLLGTVINNQVQIYFDLNPPIATNTTFHTLDENFMTIVLELDRMVQKQIDLQVHPNPFSNQTIIELKGQEFEDLELQLIDISGRKQVPTYRVEGQQIILSKGRIGAGVYFVRISEKGRMIASGKLVVR